MAWNLKPRAQGVRASECGPGVSVKRLFAWAALGSHLERRDNGMPSYGFTAEIILTERVCEPLSLRLVQSDAWLAGEGNVIWPIAQVVIKFCPRVRPGISKIHDIIRDDTLLVICNKCHIYTLPIFLFPCLGCELTRGLDFKASIADDCVPYVLRFFVTFKHSSDIK